MMNNREFWRSMITAWLVYGAIISYIIYLAATEG
jgi:hypothetical protein